ncbi:YjcG family protein [Bacillus sp. ISL-47]|uniref:YjcG family protein n=1 Tax=Bacillus sp. ISL-47 TaxID=2819130 RepID=UPI001BE7C822|nr:YjcG family protein [Bacillus sp. ISL-47]MBT2688301.1 YjcG family protein [Bacillus sp. ISL-47]MBT2710094.1 YjcG family protein [Pseudomonas sp. ISL-84]
MSTKYGIVIFPSKKLQDLANSYRKRYDPHYALIPPHVTLRSGFEASEEEIKVLTETLHGIAIKHQPFQINASKISSFQPVNNVIYFKIEPTSQLEELHRELNDNIAAEGPEYNFVPHITIGQKLSNDEHSDVYGSLRMQPVNHEEVIDRFHLLYQLENGSWTVYETFRLGKD